ncbi:hypothetical protein, partial [Propionivibrio sp.]|uniref:hypothetical protein n=1 Tax=Propionivibrio sp. TaxID=2212460 RepID=UPI0025F1EC83
ARKPASTAQRRIDSVRKQYERANCATFWSLLSFSVDGGKALNNERHLDHEWPRKSGTQTFPTNAQNPSYA